MISFRLSKRLRAPGGEMSLQVETSIGTGECVALWGESGAGKTSLLRMLAGLMKPDEGQIVVNGQTWFDSETGIHLPPQQRKPGFVFQDYALFPHMTVKRNLLFAAQHPADFLPTLLRATGLEGMEQLRPGTLSGGQKQRVALARALMMKPGLLLLDEPFAAIGQELRVEIRQFLRQLRQEWNMTILLVSHQPEDILFLADRVLAFRGGKIVQEATPAGFFGQPVTSGQLSLRATVEALTQDGTTWKVQLRMGDSLVCLDISAEEAGQLVPGQALSLSALQGQSPDAL